MQLIARVDRLQANFVQLRRVGHHWRGHGASGEAERFGHSLVTPIADLGIEQLDVMSARGKGMTKRDERADVAFASPGLNPDAHVSR